MRSLSMTLRCVIPLVLALFFCGCARNQAGFDVKPDVVTMVPEWKDFIGIEPSMGWTLPVWHRWKITCEAFDTIQVRREFRIEPWRKWMKESEKDFYRDWDEQICGLIKTCNTDSGLACVEEFYQAQEFLSEHHEHPAKRVRQDTLYYRGVLSYQAGTLRDAYSSFLAVTNTDHLANPCNAGDVWIGMGLIMLRSGHVQQAVALLHKATQESRFKEDRDMANSLEIYYGYRPGNEFYVTSCINRLRNGMPSDYGFKPWHRLEDPVSMKMKEVGALLSSHGFLLTKQLIKPLYSAREVFNPMKHRSRCLDRDIPKDWLPGWQKLAKDQPVSDGIDHPLKGKLQAYSRWHTPPNYGRLANKEKLTEAGQVALGSGMLQEAISYFSACLRDPPVVDKGLACAIGMGQSLLRAGVPESAHDALEKARSLLPPGDDRRVLVDYLDAWALRHAGKTEAAQGAIKALCQAKPKDSENKVFDWIPAWACYEAKKF